MTEKSVCGETPALKERTLGVAVFGREPDYDTNQDPVVRATATEIRKKLAQYYQLPEHREELQISLPAGSYLPEFQFAHAAPTPVEPAETVPARVPARPRLLWMGVLAAVLAIAVIAAVRVQQSPLDRFWGRMLGSRGILVCIGQQAAYNLRSEKKQLEMAALIERTPSQSLAGSNETVPLSDLVPMPGRYLAFGDALALVRVASFLDKRTTPYFMRTSGSTNFPDLREHPAVLIGAFDNDWTLRFGAALRFTFVKSFGASGAVTDIIRDREHPENMSWSLMNSWPDWNVSEDYGIISRVVDPGTDHMIISIAGITQYGTVGAAEFISRSEYFDEVLSKLPLYWEKKNIQIVLKVPVIHGASAHPRVLATYVW
ncbi:MAG: hypothetical protein JO061_06670 [Acidobacteriaceae bacterium]|nr:hypothetical protein [Acidobacteriaceae bacterium]